MDHLSLSAFIFVLHIHFYSQIPPKNRTEVVPYVLFSWWHWEVYMCTQDNCNAFVHFRCLRDRSVYFCSLLSPTYQHDTHCWDTFQLNKSEAHVSRFGLPSTICHSWHTEVNYQFMKSCVVGTLLLFFLIIITLPEDCWMNILEKSLTSYIHCPQHSHLQLIPFFLSK